MTDAIDETFFSIYHSFLNIYVLLDDGDRHALQAASLTPSQYNLLSRLENETVGLTITDLAHHLLCTRGNITRMVQRLEKHELIQIAKDADDQRRLRITLTPAGKAAYEAANNAHITSLRQRFAALSSTEQQQLFDLLQKVTTMLEANLSQD